MNELGVSADWRDEVVILIADDDPGHVRLVEKNLRRAGLSNRILRFEHGEALLEFLFSSAAGSETAREGTYLLLLDVRMPRIDGVEVLRQVKADPVLRKLPVIMLTTTDDPREITRCYDYGCNNYLVKPVDYERFAATILKLGMFVSLMRVPGLGDSGGEEGR